MTFLFSPNKHFENLVCDQRVFELIGYVEDINVKNAPYRVLKFIFTNGDAKIICVMFGDYLIERHLPKLVEGRMIHLDGGVVRSQLYPSVTDHPCCIVIDETSMIEYF